MKRMNRLLIGIFTTLLLLGCDIHIPAPKRELPTIGPVSQGTGGKTAVNWEIRANTNCAEVGEVVTFTITMVNGTTHPVTIKGKPLLDIVISPAGWPFTGPMPIQRWSESNQYPSTINPVLTAGEARTYQWNWTADAVYGQQGVYGIEAKFTTGDIVYPGGSATPAGGIDIGLGVGSTSFPRPGAWIRCAEMRH